MPILRYLEAIQHVTMTSWVPKCIIHSKPDSFALHAMAQWLARVDQYMVSERLPLCG